MQEINESTDLSKDLSLEWVTDLAGFFHLRSEWCDLIQHSNASLFNSWEWLYPWYRQIAPERELLILLIRNVAGKLCGLLPLSIRVQATVIGEVRHLCLLGDQEVGSDYLDIIVRQGCEGGVIPAVAKALKSSVPCRWDKWELTGICQDSWMMLLLQENFKSEEYFIRSQATEECHYGGVDPQVSFESQYQKQLKHINYKPRRRWLEKQAGFQILRVTEPDEIHAALDVFFKLHALRWNPQGGSAAVTGDRIIAFHREASVYLAERKQICLYSLSVGGNPIASTYVLRQGNRHLCYQAGMNPDWRAKCPGLILLVETFKDCIATGGTEYDFLRGQEPYKSDWVGSKRTLMTVTIHQLHGKGRLIFAGGKMKLFARHSIKKLVPEVILQQRRRMMKKIRIWNANTHL